jgi:polysaccharide deacetylase 2 family uncharacterized protein YibQ
VPWIKKLCCFALLISAFGSSAQGKIVLIIDDVGYNKQDIDALTIEGPLTYAVLPHTPFAKAYAQIAHDAQKDVMLHIPMESLSGKDLGPGALMTDMNQPQFEARLTAALKEIPFAIGINNHMGSLLTQKSTAMLWTMQFLQRHKLFFVDSKTSRFSLGEEYANKAGIASFHRNVFIDNDLSEAAMQKQLKLLIRIAQKYHRSIGIAHPYPETVKFLNKNLPLLKNYGVKLVPISDLLPQSNIQLVNDSKARKRVE